MRKYITEREMSASACTRSIIERVQALADISRSVIYLRITYAWHSMPGWNRRLAATLALMFLDVTDWCNVRYTGLQNIGNLLHL